MHAENDAPLPKVPPILMGCYGPAAFLVCVVCAYAFWSNAHNPGHLNALLKQIRDSEEVPSQRAVTASSDELHVRGAQLSSFVVEILNDNGKLQHAFYVSFGTFGFAEGKRGFSRIRGASFERHATPFIDAKMRMTSGGGIDRVLKNAFVFDTGPQIAGDTLGLASVVYNDTRVPLTVEFGLADTISDQEHVIKPAIFLRNGLTGANVDIDTANIPPGKRIVVRVFGFLR